MNFTENHVSLLEMCCNFHRAGSHFSDFSFDGHTNGNYDFLRCRYYLRRR